MRIVILLPILLTACPDTGKDSADTGNGSQGETGDDTSSHTGGGTVESIVVAPDSLTLDTTRTAGAFTATAVWSDGTESDISGDCVWTAADPNVVFLDMAGSAHGISPGETVATCTYSGLTDDATVTVGPFALALAGEVVINELLADPAVGADPNQDGTADATQDEFVELVNAAGYSVDLEGLTLWDSQQDSARHTFGPNSTLKPGEAVVVFGGGMPALGVDRCNAYPAWNDDNSLQLGLGMNNEGDTLTLRATDGTVVGSLTFDGSIEDASIVLNPEISGTDYTHHSYVTDSVGAYSPCTLSTGAAFPTVSERLAR